MIAQKLREKAMWHPGGFSGFRDYYPLSQWPTQKYTIDRSELFIAAWHRQQTIPRQVAIVLTPGLFAEWLPQCFRQARRGFEKDGHRCLRTRVSTRHSVESQARLITQSILDWLAPDERFIWCTHSKGGIDALWALDHHEELQERCSALAMMQLPVEHSWVIEAMRNAPPGFLSSMGNKALSSRWFRPGIDAISAQRDSKLHAWLSGHIPTVPAIHAVSWSITPTSWADSWHRQLNRLRPQHAHDGQFYMQDQYLHQLPHIGLPRLDHAQPVLGGQGLNTARLWTAMAHTAWLETQAR